MYCSSIPKSQWHFWQTGLGHGLSYSQVYSHITQVIQSTKIYCLVVNYLFLMKKINLFLAMHGSQCTMTESMGPWPWSIWDHRPWPASMVLTLSNMVTRGLQGKHNAGELFIAGFHVTSSFSKILLSLVVKDACLSRNQSERRKISRDHR